MYRPIPSDSMDWPPCGECSSTAEHRPVAPVVGGSIPLTHPNFSDPVTDGLPHRLTRTITLAAPRELVFQFLSVSDRWAAWWGSGSVIDAHPGGAIHIRHPNGVEVSGQVLDVRPPEAIAFSYAYTAAAPDARGPSQVAIELVPVPEGTRLTLTHAFADVEARDNHVQGWRYQ